MCNREKSMYIDKEDVVQVKDAFKWAVQGLVGKELGAPVFTNVSVSIANVSFTVNFSSKIRLVVYLLCTSQVYDVNVSCQ